MTKTEFKHYGLTLVEPAFKASLMEFIIDLNHLLKKDLNRITSPQFFSILTTFFIS